jgi:hypothetical protein
MRRPEAQWQLDAHPASGAGSRSLCEIGPRGVGGLTCIHWKAYSACSRKWRRKLALRSCMQHTQQRQTQSPNTRTGRRECRILSHESALLAGSLAFHKPRAVLRRQADPLSISPAPGRTPSAYLQVEQLGAGEVADVATRAGCRLLPPPARCGRTWVHWLLSKQGEHHLQQATTPQRQWRPA